jgi:hypothetical protein
MSAHRYLVQVELQQVGAPKGAPSFIGDMVSGPGVPLVVDEARAARLEWFAADIVKTITEAWLLAVGSNVRVTVIPAQMLPQEHCSDSCTNPAHAQTRTILDEGPAVTLGLTSPQTARTDRYVVQGESCRCGDYPGGACDGCGLTTLQAVERSLSEPGFRKVGT